MQHVVGAWIVGLLVMLIGGAVLSLQDGRTYDDQVCKYPCYQPTGLKIARQDISGRHTVYVVR